MSSIKHRVAKLETKNPSRGLDGLPLHLPFTEWTLEQIAAFAQGHPENLEQIPDDQLSELIQKLRAAVAEFAGDDK